MKKSKKSEFITKKVKFGKQDLMLFSLDGVTWSTRKDELLIIKERHEAERNNLLKFKEEEVVKDDKEASTEDTADSKDIIGSVVEQEDDSKTASSKRGKVRSIKSGKANTKTAKPQKRASSKVAVKQKIRKKAA